MASRSKSLPEDASAAAEADAPASVKSALRVLDLLEHLGRWNDRKTHAEIAEGLGIPKSSLTPLLRTMVGRGFLEYAAASKTYALGPAVAELAARSSQGRALADMAEDVLRRLAGQTRESCALNVRRGDSSEVLASAAGDQRLNYIMRVGDTAPLYATSGGKALLAAMPTEFQEAYFARVTFEPFTPNTIGSVGRLRDEIEEVQRSGLAFVFEEFTPGIVGIAKAVLDGAGRPLAAVNVTIPVVRYDEGARDRCKAALEAAVSALCKSLD